MCGILGGWFDRGNVSEAVSEALDAIRHRGPDDEGKFTDGPAFLAMRRLAIIDLAGGHQPIFNEDRSLAVVCNGEIYNYKELVPELKARGHCFRTESDVETLLHLYEEKGEAMVEELRGMFAFAIWDAKQRRLFLARDRFGKKPLYYWQQPGKGFFFASEIKALLPLLRQAGIQPEVNPQAIYDYLSLLAIPQPATIYREIFVVPAGSTAIFDHSGFRTRKYWQISYRPKTTLAYPDLLEHTRELISESVRIRLRSDVPFGVFLSGGIDSSIVALEAARQTGSSLQTFTIASKDAALDESAEAARTAGFLGVANTVLNLEVPPLEALNFIVRHYDQPFADSSAIPSFYVSKLAAEHVKVVLNGDGGDELFAGYRRHLAARWQPLLRWFPGTIMAECIRQISPARRSSLGFYMRLLRGLKQPASTRYLIWTADAMREFDKQKVWVGPPGRPTESLLESFDRSELDGLDAQLFLDVNVNLVNALLVKMDMATMAASLEARSPFLDHRLAEFAATIPSHVLVRGRTTKPVLRDAYAHLLPPPVVSAPKRGFEIPMQAWLEGDLKTVLHDTVLSSDARLAAYIDHATVVDIVHRATFRDRNWAYIVYSLLVLELWLRNAESERRVSAPYSAHRS
jgi:asparagine synthase (glutamine-hydrolysing)